MKTFDIISAMDFFEKISRRDFMKLAALTPFAPIETGLKFDSNYSAFWSGTDLARLIEKVDANVSFQDAHSFEALLDLGGVTLGQFSKTAKLLNIKPLKLYNSNITWLAEQRNPQTANFIARDLPESETALIRLSRGENHVLHTSILGGITAHNLRDVFDDYDPTDFFKIYRDGVLFRSRQLEGKRAENTVLVHNGQNYEKIDMYYTRTKTWKFTPGVYNPISYTPSSGVRYIHLQNNFLVAYREKRDSVEIQKTGTIPGEIYKFFPKAKIRDNKWDPIVLATRDLTGTFKLEARKADNAQPGLIFDLRRKDSSHEVLLLLEPERLGVALKRFGYQMITETNPANIYESFNESKPEAVIYVQDQYGRKPWILISREKNGQTVIKEDIETVQLINSLPLDNWPYRKRPDEPA